MGYEFNGETFTTETIESETKAPKFKYEFVHHVDSVTQEFIDWLQKPFHINVFVTPYVSNPPHDKISSNNEAIVANITGKKPSLEGKAAEIRSLKKQLATLQKERDQLAKENKELKAKLGGGAKKKAAKKKKLNTEISQITDNTDQFRYPPPVPYMNIRQYF